MTSQTTPFDDCKSRCDGGEERSRRSFVGRVARMLGGATVFSLMGVASTSRKASACGGASVGPGYYCDRGVKYYCGSRQYSINGCFCSGGFCRRVQEACRCTNGCSVCIV